MHVISHSHPSYSMCSSYTSHHPLTLRVPRVDLDRVLVVVDDEEDDDVALLRVPRLGNVGSITGSTCDDISCIIFNRNTIGSYPKPHRVIRRYC